MDANLTIADARSAILAAVEPTSVRESIPLERADGRFLGDDIATPRDLPPFAAAAMDGYAALPTEAGTPLRIVGESRAGAPATAPPGPGEAIAISTGALAPAGVGVAPIETVTVAEGAISPDLGIDAGDHVREAGEDLRAGELAITRGTRLDPAALALAASCGLTDVSCAAQPSVAIVVTGDELTAAGEPLAEGAIHDSNSTLLTLLARRAGATVTSAVTVGDDREATEGALASALDGADLTLTSGGVSVGEHDLVRPVLDDLGVEEVFWRVALKPGGPTWFGRRGRSLVFGLPGNPVSAFVTFQLFVRPAIRALQGGAPLPVRWHGRLSQPVGLGAREQAIRVSVDPGADGPPLITPTGAQGSHRSSSLLGAWGLALLPRGEGELPAGTVVPVEPNQP